MHSILALGADQDSLIGDKRDRVSICTYCVLYFRQHLHGIPDTHLQRYPNSATLRKAQVFFVQERPGHLNQKANLHAIVKMRFILVFTVLIAAIMAVPAPAPAPEPEALPDASMDDIVEPKRCCL